MNGKLFSGVKENITCLMHFCIHIYVKYKYIKYMFHIPHVTGKVRASNEHKPSNITWFYLAD